MRASLSAKLVYEIRKRSNNRFGKVRTELGSQCVAVEKSLAFFLCVLFSVHFNSWSVSCVLRRKRLIGSTSTMSLMRLQRHSATMGWIRRFPRSGLDIQLSNRCLEACARIVEDREDYKVPRLASEHSVR